MPAINILPCGAVRFSCPEDLRLLIEEKFGNVAVKKADASAWIDSLDSADFVYEFKDSVVVVHNGAPLVPKEVVV